MMAMIRKELRQLVRDRRTLALLLFVPLLLLTVFGYAARFDVDSVPTILAGPDGGEVGPQLPALFEVVDTDPGGDETSVHERLRDGEAVVGLVIGPRPAAMVDGSQLFAARAALAALQQSGLGVEPQVLFNPELATSVIMIPALIGLILVFVGTIATSLGVVREREGGTLEQLAVMPLSPRDVFAGKVAPYLFVASLDMVVVVAAGMVLFDTPFAGSPLLFALAALVFLFVTLGLGVLVSTVSRTQGEAIQLALMTLLPQVLLSGLLFPIEAMGVGVRWIAYLLPLTYFIDIARGVMVRGAGIEAVGDSLALLAALAAAVSVGAVLRFRRELSPAAEDETPTQDEVVPAGVT